MSISQPNATTAIENLGTHTYENLVLKGTRESLSSGTTDDFWCWAALSIYVIHTHEDPKWKQTITVTHIDRGEPDPSLFVVPDTYKVVDGAPINPAVSLPGEPVVYRAGGRRISSPGDLLGEPQYSDEARSAKLQGICVVSVIVDTSGMPRNARVVRPVGMGLDEKAIEAVRQYRFKPAMYAGHPVSVEVNIEVNFRLF